MGRIKKYYMQYLIFIIMTIFTSGYTEELICNTADDKEGLCVYEIDCPYILEIKENETKSQNQKTFYEDSYCGEVADNIKVCCNIEMTSLCPTISEPSIDLQCFYRGIPIDCNQFMVNNTIVYPICKPSFVQGRNAISPLNCVNGVWSRPFPRCIFPCPNDWKCDRFLIVNKQRYPVNKERVTSISKYLSKAFSDSKKISVVLRGLGNIDFNTIQEVINYIHTDKIDDWKIKKCPEIIEISQILESEQIETVCLDFMYNYLNEKNYLHFLRKYQQLNNTLLRDRVILYIKKNFDTLILKKNWLKYNATEISTVIQDDDLNVKSEYQVFEAVMNWTQHDWCHRSVHFTYLMNYTRLDQISLEDKLKKMAPKCSDVTNSETCYDLIAKSCLMSSNFIYVSKKRRREDNITLIAVASIEKLVSRKIEMYNPDEDSWSLLTDIGLDRFWFTSVIFNGLLMMFGGLEMDKIVSDKAWYMDLSKQTIHELPRMRLQRYYAKCIVIDGLIYVVGGRDNDDNIMTTVERYNPITQQWNFTAPIPKNFVYYGVEAWRSKMYLTGGYFDDKTFSNDVFIYDTKTDTWETGPSMTIYRGSHGVAIHNNYLYCIGGQNSTKRGVFLSYVERLNLITHEWQQVEDLPEKHFAVTATEFRNKIIASYGRNIYEYNPKTNHWKTLNSFKEDRYNHNMLKVPRSWLT